MHNQPNTPPIHHNGKVLPNARKKFSVLMDISKALQITFTLLLGAGIDDAIILPNSVATPINALTVPSAISPPFSDDKIIAGKAALYMDAIRFIQARNRIKSKIPLFCFK